MLCKDIVKKLLLYDIIKQVFLLEREKINFDRKKCSLYKYYAYLCTWKYFS